MELGLHTFVDLAPGQSPRQRMNELMGERWHHRIQNTRVEWCCRVVVEIYQLRFHPLFSPLFIQQLKLSI